MTSATYNRFSELKTYSITANSKHVDAQLKSNIYTRLSVSIT